MATLNEKINSLNEENRQLHERADDLQNQLAERTKDSTQTLDNAAKQTSEEEEKIPDQPLSLPAQNPEQTKSKLNDMLTSQTKMVGLYMDQKNKIERLTRDLAKAREE